MDSTGNLNPNAHKIIKGIMEETNYGTFPLLTSYTILAQSGCDPPGTDGRFTTCQDRDPPGTVGRITTSQDRDPAAHVL